MHLIPGTWHWLGVMPSLKSRACPLLQLLWEKPGWNREVRLEPEDFLKLLLDRVIVLSPRQPRSEGPCGGARACVLVGRVGEAGRGRNTYAPEFRLHLRGFSNLVERLTGHLEQVRPRFRVNAEQRITTPNIRRQLSPRADNSLKCWNLMFSLHLQNSGS